MVLEAVMICVDNSEPMRNGDYSPTRFQAMVEAVNEIANAKISGNNETTVGVMSMASRIEVHLSPCGSLGSIMSCLQKEVKIGGECNFVGALKTAQLALKNRPNKSQKQRIILFVGSPITEDGKELVKLGKVFKKNNVAVDVVNFGTENSQGQKTQNPEKLEAFVGAVNSGDNSHLVHIPPGPHIFSDLVLTSALMVSGAAGAGATSTAAAPGLGPGLGLGGVDPNMEPELAMALRISQEEARQQQEKSAKEAKAAGKPVAMDESQDEEAQMLAAAIAMSMAAGEEQAPTSQPKPAAAPAKNNNSQSANSGAGTSKPAAPKSEATPMDDVDDVLKDPDFINSLLDSVPGMNKDVTVDDILATMGDKDKDKDGKKKEDPKKDGGKK